MKKLFEFLNREFILTPWGLVENILQKEVIPNSMWTLEHRDATFGIRVDVEYGESRYGPPEGRGIITWDTTSNHRAMFVLNRIGKKPWTIAKITLGTDKSKHFYNTIIEWAKEEGIPVERK